MDTDSVGDLELPAPRINYLQALMADEEIGAARNTGERNRPEHWLGPLTTLNVLVGANNTGKSRLLRSTFGLWKRMKPVFLGSGISDAEWIDLIRMFRNAGDFRGRVQQLVAAGLSHAQMMLRSLDPGDDRALNAEASRWANEWLWSSFDSPGARSLTREQILSDAGPMSPNRLATLGRCLDFNMTQTTFVYVPALRSVRPRLASWTPPDELGEICRSHYFEGLRALGENVLTSSDVCILSGQSFYSLLRQKLLGTLAERRMMERFQGHLSECYFEGQNVTIIPKETSETFGANHTLHIKIGKEKEQPVHLLGDGVGQLLILLYPLFAYSDRNLVLLVEEPELFLHPGFQRQLIRSYTESKKNGGVPHHRSGSRQIVVATHSPCFIDATLESDKISIFHVTKQFDQPDQDEGQPVVQFNRRSSADRPLLRELGVRNSSVLLTNCTIWVEGPSDRMYLLHFLRLYAQRSDGGAPSFRAREDIDYTIAMYAGSNLGHWYFGHGEEGPEEGDDGAAPIWVGRLCGEAMVVADRDDTETKEGKKSERIQQLQLLLKDKLHVAPVREIENLLTPDNLKAALRLWHRSPISDAQFQGFDHDSYRDNYLGSFIRDKVFDPSFKLRKMLWKKAGKNGPADSTIPAKAEFAKCAIDAITDYEQLSNEAKELTEAVVRHIHDHSR
jgi:hypothetical protein